MPQAQLLGAVVLLVLAGSGLAACGSAAGPETVTASDPPMWDSALGDRGLNPQIQAVATGNKLSIWRTGGPLVAVAIGGAAPCGWTSGCAKGTLSLFVPMRNATRLDGRPILVRIGYHLNRGDGWAQALFSVDRDEGGRTVSDDTLAKIAVDVATPTGRFSIPVPASDVRGAGGLGLRIRYELQALLGQGKPPARFAIDYVELAES